MRLTQQYPITNYVKLEQKIRSSNLLWEVLLEDAHQKPLNWLVPILDVRVRWNSTRKIIPHALYLHPALDRLLIINNSQKFSKARVVLTLLSQDWDILECVEKILGLFLVATEFASRSTYPTLSAQLPYYHFLQYGLHEIIANERLVEDDPDPPSGTYRICAAAEDTYQKLNEYLVKSNSHMGRIIVTILDARMKLHLLQNLKCQKLFRLRMPERSLLQYSISVIQT